MELEPSYLEFIEKCVTATHGALRVDLARPIRRAEWRGAFDVVTNSGTTGHVEPFAAQYVCFRNIHDCLRPGGVAISLVPDVEELDRRGAWQDHCNHYYSHAFFVRLAELNQYELVASKLRARACASTSATASRSFRACSRRSARSTCSCTTATTPTRT